MSEVPLNSLSKSYILLPSFPYFAITSPDKLIVACNIGFMYIFITQRHCSDAVGKVNYILETDEIAQLLKY